MDNTEIKRRLIERLADSSTALICNAYDFMGKIGATEKSNIVGQLSKEFRGKINKISDFEEI